MAEVNRWGVVYSPHGGFDRSNKRWGLMRKYMEQRGVQYDFVQSESFGSVARLVAMLCDNGYHTIVVVGGDGSLNSAVNVLMEKRKEVPDDFAFAIIPNGVGNDFSRFWGVSVDDYKRVIDSIIARNVRKIDVAYCIYNDPDNVVPQKRYFLNCINIGLGARLIKTTNDTKFYTGSRRFSIIPAILTRIFERRLFNISLKIETEEIKDKFMSVCIGNCHSYGQTPNAVPYNGMLDVSLITRPEWWQILEGFWLLGKGRFLNYKNVHPYRAQRITVNATDKAYVSFDGLVLSTKNPTPMSIGVEKETIPFIAPQVHDF